MSIASPTDIMMIMVMMIIAVLVVPMTFRKHAEV